MYAVTIVYLSISSFLPIPNRFPIRTQIYIDDLREEFVRDYVFPMFRANAVYEGTYLLGTSIARPLISKRQIEIAKEVGADAVCHGTLIWHIICNSCMGTYGRLD